jgi:hypothetical protein
MRKTFLTAIAAFLTVLPSVAEELQYGRNVTDFASAPKIGGYVIGKYSYTDQDDKHDGDGFSQRLVRLYADGTILNDFKYRVQVQIYNEKFHMKDYYLEWAHWKEFSVKVGQFKRAFLFENPYNPWNVGFGDYSQITKKLSGMGDYCGEPGSTGGRDQGIQVQGDLFPVSDGYRLLHYQLQLMNGQGINTGDANARKDVIGTLQLQPIKDLYIGVFGWTGDYCVNDSVTVGRDRWAVSAKYEHNDWSARAEYAHSNGKNINEADGWYAVIGVPVNDWFKVYAKYDVYRKQASNEYMCSMYSIAPNFQIHKNLMFQLQYNFVQDKKPNKPDASWNELWAEIYVRF